MVYYLIVLSCPHNKPHIGKNMSLFTRAYRIQSRVKPSRPMCSGVISLRKFERLFALLNRQKKMISLLVYRGHIEGNERDINLIYTTHIEIKLRYLGDHGCQTWLSLIKPKALTPCLTEMADRKSVRENW